MTVELTFEKFYLGAWGVRALAAGACRRRSSRKHAPVRGIHKKRCDYESCHVMGEGILYPKYNTLQQLTTTHCNNLQQHTAANYNTLQHTATHSRTITVVPEASATHCNKVQHTATNYNNTLQQTATHCNTHVPLQWSQKQAPRERPRAANIPSGTCRTYVR